MKETPSISNYTRASNAVTSMAADNWNPSYTTSNLFQHQSIDQLLGVQQVQPMATTTARRIVQVFISDTDENVPLADSILFRDEKLTDLTDTELFFEVPLAERLTAHNEKRVKWLDKSATKRSGRDVFLEPVKIRELKMVVVTIVQL